MSQERRFRRDPPHTGDEYSAADSAGKTPTVSTRAEDAIPAECWALLLLQVGQQSRAFISRLLADLNLTDARYVVLTAIRDAAGTASSQSGSEAEVSLTGGVDQASIARLTHVTESNVCTLVERMYRDGLVVRSVDPDDRRKRLLSLSEQGQRLLSQADELLRRQLAPLFASDRAAQSALAETSRLVERLAMSGDRPAETWSVPHQGNPAWPSRSVEPLRSNQQ